MHVTRRQFLVGISGLTAAAVSLPAYARWVEPRWLRTDRVLVPLFPDDNARRLRILHLSDLHLSSVVPLSFIERAILAGIAEQPDMVVITGDFITHELHQHNEYVRVLRMLSDAAPAFAVLGNHDGGRWARARGGYPNTHAVRGILSQGRIQLLHNESALFIHNGYRYRIIGVGDLWAEELRANAAFRGIAAAPEERRIVLSHNPDSKEMLGEVTWDLMLSGHTHGGQIALPIIGTPAAPVEDHRYVDGLNRWRDRWIYTSRGVGNLHGYRFNCRPEISVLNVIG